MKRTLCLGILVVDVIGRPIDSVPAPGTLALVPSISPHLGGCSANTGIGLRKLGIETLVAGKVGRDGFGDFLRQELERSGVKTFIAIDETTPTSATMVLVRSDAERTFLHCTGANGTLELDDFDLSLLDETELLHIAGHGLMPSFDGAQCARLLQIARAKGVLTCLDTAGAPNPQWCENLRLCLPYLDYFVPSWHEVRHLFPEESTPEALVLRLHEAGVKVVALKMGGQGSFVSDGQKSQFVAPFHVDAVDATGAGDGFAAGFLAGVMHDMPLAQCARLGNASGALVATQVGTTAGYHSLAETLAFMESAPEE